MHIFLCIILFTLCLRCYYCHINIIPIHSSFPVLLNHSLFWRNMFHLVSHDNKLIPKQSQFKGGRGEEGLHRYRSLRAFVFSSLVGGCFHPELQYSGCFLNISYSGKQAEFHLLCPWLHFSARTEGTSDHLGKSFRSVPESLNACVCVCVCMGVCVRVCVCVCVCVRV